MKRTNLTPRIVLCLVFIIALVFAMASCELIDKIGLGQLGNGQFGNGQLGHDHTYSSFVTEPTCITKGFTTYICECGDSYVDNYVDGGHNLVNYEAKAATCSEEGHNAYEACTKCDYTTKKSIPAIGHTLQTKVTRFPTTLTKGVLSTFCSGCGYSEDVEIAAVTATLPSVADAIHSMIGPNNFVFDAEDSEIVLIKELKVDGETKHEKNFLAVELAHLEINGECDDLDAYLSLRLGVASFDSIDENADPIFESQLMINVIVYGDEVSVAITEDGNLNKSEFSISDAFYNAVAEMFGMSYDELVECYYVAGRVSAYLPLAEGVVNWLNSLKIPEGEFNIDDLPAIIGEDILSKKDNGKTTVYTLDASELGALLVSIQDKTVAEFIDDQYGKGTMDKIEEFLLSLPNAKIKDVANSAIEFSESCGIEISSVYSLINYFIYSAAGVDFNIEKEINERYNKTVAEVIAELATEPGSKTEEELKDIADDLVDNIESVIDGFKSFTFDQLLNIYIYGNPNHTDSSGNPVSVTDQLAALLEQIDEVTYISVSVDNASGEVILVDIIVNDKLTVRYTANEDKVFTSEIYLNNDICLSLSIADYEYIESIVFKIYNAYGDTTEIFNGEFTHVHDGTGEGTKLTVKYLEDTVFFADYKLKADGSFDSITVDVYTIVYDYDKFIDGETGIESVTEEKKIYQIIDIDTEYVDGSYVITNKINGVKRMGESGEDGVTGNQTVSMRSELYEVGVQTVVYTKTENGYTLTMTTVSDEKTVQSADIRYENGEIVYLNLVINSSFTGKLEGSEDEEHFLNMLTVTYEKNTDGSFELDAVINRINSYWTPDQYIEETDEWIMGEYVREFVSVLDLNVSYNGEDTLTADVNDGVIEIVNTTTAVGNEITLNVTNSESELVNIVIVSQSFDNGEFVTDEFHVKGTVSGTDVNFTAVDSEKSFYLVFALDSEDLVVYTVDKVDYSAKLVINRFVYGEERTVENLLTYEVEEGKLQVKFDNGQFKYDYSIVVDGDTEKLTFVAYEGEDLLVDLTVNVTLTDKGVNVAYSVKGLRISHYYRENIHSDIIPPVPGEDNPNDSTGYFEYVEYDGSDVTIVFYHTMGQANRAVLDQYIAKFNEMYPNINVVHVQVGGYDDVRDQIKTEITAGCQPNIAYCYPDHVALYNIARVVVPLDEFIMSDSMGLTQEQIDNFVDGFYAEGMMFDNAGTMYTLPMSKSTEVLYYNKSFFEAHGLSVPTTWDEVADVCEKILEIDPYCTPFGYDSESNWFITMCEQYGNPYTSVEGDHYLFDNPENREFVKMLREWYDRGYFTTQELYGAYMSDPFTQQYCYMYVGSSAGAKYSFPSNSYYGGSFEVGIAPIPQVEPWNPKAISQGPSLCIFKQDNPQEVAASWLFVKYLTTDPEFQADFSMVTGYIPVIEREVLVEAVPVYGMWLDSANGYDKSTAPAYSISVAYEQMDAFFVSPAFNGSSKARDEVGHLMQYCFVVQTDDIDAMIEKAFIEAINECKYYY